MAFDAPLWLTTVVRLAAGLIATGVGLGLAGLGLGLLREVGRHIWLARASQTWTAVAGVIVSAELRREGARRNLVVPRVRYRYHAAGVAQEGERLWFATTPAAGQDAAQQVLDRYAPGATVTVYYDPERPTLATLERRHTDALTDAGLGLLLVASAALVGIVPGLGILWDLWSNR